MKSKTCNPIRPFSSSTQVVDRRKKLIMYEKHVDIYMSIDLIKEDEQKLP